MRATNPVTALVALSASLVARDAYAIRPFITDDARVVGRHCGQVETWVRGDRAAVQHWVLAAIGPVGPVELSLGGVYGATFHDGAARFGATGPLVQGKFLLRRTRFGSGPGVALSAGGVPPVHVGQFGAAGWDGFAYAAFTQSLRDAERLFVHANVGVYATTAPVARTVSMTWGVGVQAHVVAGFNLVAELFSGDPYVGRSGGASQVGFRYIFSDVVQMDATVGHGLWGETVMPLWGTVGLRLASEALW